VIYEYECSACHLRVEHLLKVADRDKPPACDQCGGALVRRITPPEIVLDGTDTGFPGAADKWERDRYRTMAREEKNLRDSGEAYVNRRMV